jgi:hypothetical protein
MRFEDDLEKALRHTAGTFTTDRHALAQGSLSRGRRRLARRRASAIVGSALTVALLASTAAHLGAQRDGDGKARGNHASTPRPASDYRHFAVTAEDMKNILHNGMNRAGIAVTDPTLQATGSSDPTHPATATIDFRDGWGPARVTLSVRRVDPAERDLKKLITCPPETPSSPYEECTTQPDNRAVKGYTKAGAAGKVKEWAVTLLSPNGYLIETATHNLPTTRQTDSAPANRNPRMNPGKLRSLAMFVGSSFTPGGEPNAFGTVEPGSEADPGDILPILKALLPERLHIHSEGGSAAQGHVVVTDPKTGERTYIEATRTAGDKESWNETLTDGTKVSTRQLPGSHPGVIQLRVDALRPNGLWITLSAYNAPSPTSPKNNNADHPITTQELKAIATDPTWYHAR